MQTSQHAGAHQSRGTIVQCSYGMVLMTCTLVACSFPLDCRAIEASEFAATWEKQRNEIETAEMAFQYMTVGASELRVTTHDDVNKAVENIQSRLTKNAFSTPQLVEAVSSHIVKPDRIEEVWCGGRFYFESPGNSRFDVLRGGEIRRSYVTIDKLEIVADTINDQISLNVPGSSSVHRHRMSDFRFIPRLTQERLEQFDATEVDGVLHLTRGNLPIYSIDSETGLLQRREQRDANGVVVRAQFQLGTYSHADDIYFPRLSIDLRYSEGKLYLVQVIAADKYKFNEELIGNPFAVASFEGGANVFDYRHKENRRSSFVRVANDVDDVVAHVEALRQARAN